MTSKQADTVLKKLSFNFWITLLVLWVMTMLGGCSSQQVGGTMVGVGDALGKIGAAQRKNTVNVRIRP